MATDIGRVGIWWGGGDALPAAATVEAARTIEELGYGALWVPETVGRDPLVYCAGLLAGTSTLTLATGIANIYARDPMTMSAAQKTLAEAHPGRFLLGLGVSHHHLVERLRGHEYSKPYTYMKRYLEQMAAAMYRAVAPDEEPPIVLAALGPRMLALSASAAQGAHPYFTTPEHTAIARSVIGPDALLAPEQMVVLDTDPATARATARTNMAVYLRAPNYRNSLSRLGFDDADLDDGGSDRLVDAVVAWGDEAAIAARVEEHHAAGADHVCIQVLRDDLEVPDEGWRRLAPALL